jgi:hypothetical protein
MGLPKVHSKVCLFKNLFIQKPIHSKIHLFKSLFVHFFISSFIQIFLFLTIYCPYHGQQFLPADQIASNFAQVQWALCFAAFAKIYQLLNRAGIGSQPEIGMNATKAEILQAQAAADLQMN